MYWQGFPWPILPEQWKLKLLVLSIKQVNPLMSHRLGLWMKLIAVFRSLFHY